MIDSEPEISLLKTNVSEKLEIDTRLKDSDLIVTKASRKKDGIKWYGPLDHWGGRP